MQVSFKFQQHQHGSKQRLVGNTCEVNNTQCKETTLGQRTVPLIHIRTTSEVILAVEQYEIEIFQNLLKSFGNNNISNNLRI